MEPSCKRSRLDETYSEMFVIKSILSDEFSTDIKLEKVFAALIENTKNISTIIEEINRCLPINELQHLKRVRKKQIILQTKEDVLAFITNEWEEKFNNFQNKMNTDYAQFTDDILKINPSELYAIVNKETISKSLLKCFVFYYLTLNGISYQTAKDLASNATIEEVPCRVPKLKWQYEKVNKIWPCKFHLDKYMESLFTGVNFKAEESDFHQKMCSMLNFLSKNESDKEVGICIDPRTNSVVAIATEKLEQNPMFHCTMVLIDFVARTQNGGVWNFDTDKFMENGEDLNFQGVTERHFKLVKENFKNIKFGSEKINLNRKITNLDISSENNLCKYGPYLCTGYDVYLLREPCLMCGMALVHSRVRRLFYIKQNEHGAFGSKLKLHTIKGLNHRFEVFHCFENK